MVIAFDGESVSRYMSEAVEYSQERPVLVDHFLEDAVEVDVDALCDERCRHRRHHAAHRGSRHPFRRFLLRPACRRSRAATLDTIRGYTRQLALALNVIGLVNLQFAIQRRRRGADKVFVIEVNPRASRTVPYVSKATGIPLAKIASRLMTGRTPPRIPPNELASGHDLETGSHYYVKSPVFPWNKFAGVDTVLGPEMKSTGEVMGVADNFGEAFAKAQLSAGQILPTGAPSSSASTIATRPTSSTSPAVMEFGFNIVATEGTANAIEKAGMTVDRVFKVKEGRPNIVDLIKGDRIQLIINTPRGQ